MRLGRLNVHNVRNIRESALSLSPRVNIIFGENASGKTTLLESIFILSCGKSFRTPHLSNVLKKGEDHLRITGRVVEPSGHDMALGIEYGAGRMRIRADGNALRRASDLANHLPIVVIHQESQKIIANGPRRRRQFLDWGVFHVEHSYLPAWKRYSRALKQRNASLQRRGSGVPEDVWDSELADAAWHIHLLRERYMQHFLRLLPIYAEKLVRFDGDIMIEYQPGWPVDMDYKVMLNQALPQDRAIGYTRKGPHRADIVIKINGVPAHEYVSRGQQKLLICALHLAQAALYAERTSRSSVILVDDMAAEIDERHIRMFMGVVNELRSQVILTTTHREKLVLPGHADRKMFHVEHGSIREVV